jgi:hypothetical protein
MYVMEAMSPTMTWAVFLIVTISILTIIDKGQRYFTSLRQAKQCLHEKETIFVAIMNYSGGIAGGRCLFSLFEHAKCPFRIKVGIYEASYMPRAASVSYYESLQMRFSISSNLFTSSIKSVAASSRTNGTYTGRQHLIETAYNGEDYILTIHDGIEMLQNWDIDLITSHKKLSTSLQNTVLVAPPAPIQNMSVSSYTFRLFGMSSQKNQEPRYPIVGGFSETGLPIHTSKPFLGGSNPEGMKSLLWMSACSFAPSSFFVDPQIQALSDQKQKLCHAIPKRQLPYLFQEDTLVTCDGMASGWTFVCSPKCVSKLYYDPESTVVSTRSGIPLDDIHETSKNVRDLLHKELGPYLQELGLYKKASPRAFSGVVDLNNSIEIENKHGRKVEIN